MAENLISRKAAIDAIMDADVCVTWNGVISDDDAVDIAIKSTKGSVISSIINLPPSQPQRKKGEWIINSDGYYPYCSECRKEPKSGDMTDFCPNCGADMREGEADADVKS